MSTIPTGWSPLPFHYVNAAEVLSAGILLPLVCVGIVGLRIYARTLQKGGLGIDDWLIIPAAGLVVGMGATFITGWRLKAMGFPTPLPYGEDPFKAAELFMDAYITEAKVEFAFQTMQVIGVGLTKISIIFFCRRVFLVHKRSAFDYITQILIALNFLWTIGFFLALIFGCRQKVWLHWAPLLSAEATKYCGDQRKPLLAAVISGFILDFSTLVLPLPWIWQLRITTKQKIGVTGIFMLGFMSVAASVIRMAFYIVVLKQPYNAGYDINMAVTTMLWWSFLEVSLGVIVSCLPSLQALRQSLGLNKFLSSFRGTTKSGSGSWKESYAMGKKSEGSSSNASGNKSLVRSNSYSLHTDEYSVSEEARIKPASQESLRRAAGEPRRV